MSARTIALGAAMVIAAMGTATAASAAAPADCYWGIWKSNEELTHRTRPVMGPVIIFLGPWGNNGWERLHMGDFKTETSEMHFEHWDGKPYQVFGTDPRSQMVTKIDDYRFETRSVRDGAPADKAIMVFSNDCKRLTSTVPEGVRRDTGIKYYNDVRVYDKVEP